VTCCVCVCVRVCLLSKESAERLVCVCARAHNTGDLGTVFGEAVRLARDATWLQTGSVSLTATNASSGVFLPTGSTWLQEADTSMTLDSTQGTTAAARSTIPSPSHLSTSDAACALLLTDQYCPVGVRVVGGAWHQSGRTTIALSCPDDDQLPLHRRSANADRWGLNRLRLTPSGCTGRPLSLSLSISSPLFALLHHLNRRRCSVGQGYWRLRRRWCRGGAK